MSDVGMVQVEINYETVANIHVSHVTWHRIFPVEVERNNQNCFQMCVFGSLWREITSVNSTWNVISMMVVTLMTFTRFLKH